MAGGDITAGPARSGRGRRGAMGERRPRVLVPAAYARPFICSFSDCEATFNKAWKLDAHLCGHTGQVSARGGAGRDW